MQKKYLKKSLLFSSPLLLLTPIAIVGCTQKEPDFPQNLNEEIARINNLHLTLKNQKLSTQEIQEALNNPSYFLNNQVNGWTNNTHFIYTPTISHNVTEKKLILVIEVAATNEEIQKATSKEFIFTYQEKDGLEDEVDRINSSFIRLNRDFFTQEEINNINQSNLKSFLTGFEFHDDLFNYQIIDFQKNISDFTFKISINLLDQPINTKISNEIKTPFKIISNQPNDNQTLDEEIKQLNLSSLSLFSIELTKMQYHQIQAYNIIDFIVGYNFNRARFGYEAIEFKKTEETISFKFNIFL